MSHLVPLSEFNLFRMSGDFCFQSNAFDVARGRFADLVREDARKVAWAHGCATRKLEPAPRNLPLSINRKYGNSLRSL